MKKLVIPTMLALFILAIAFVVAQQVPTIPENLQFVNSLPHYYVWATPSGLPGYDCQQWENDLNELSQFCTNTQVQARTTFQEWERATSEEFHHTYVNSLYNKIVGFGTLYNQCLQLHASGTTVYNQHCP